MKKVMIMMIMGITTAIAGVCCGEQDCRPDCPANQIKMVTCIETIKSKATSHKEAEVVCQKLVSEKSL